MAGENVLPVEHYPDEFFTTRYFMHDSNSASRPFFFTDPTPAVGGLGREYTVDAAYLGIYGTAVGGSGTLQLVHLPVGDAPTTANFNGVNAVAITDATDISVTDTTKTFVINADNNRVPAGCYIGMKLVAGGGTLGNLRGILTVRLRSRPK